MVVTGSLQFSPLLGTCKNRQHKNHFKYVTGTSRDHQLSPPSISLSSSSSFASKQNLLSTHVHTSLNGPISVCKLPHRCHVVRCHSFLSVGQNVKVPSLETTTAALTRSYNAIQGNPLVIKLAASVGLIAFTLWGLRPLVRICRNVFSNKSDSNWKKSTTNQVMTSYLQPILLWTGAFLICRALDPIAMPTEASQLVKQRLLNFVKSLSTVLAFAYCLSSFVQQAQRYFMETNNPADTRNMGFQFAGKAIYSAVWVAAVSLFMELLGFSTQRWLTAGGLGTVLLTLAGREIFTNFLSSIMIHATRPFVLNEWIQTKIEGYEVSGTVEHVGWWSPTIIRGEDREAVHIPNHKFTVNVVRNLSQKTHWRIKTHLAISHLDISKINSIVADMRKVLSKNPNVEQQRLHRRVFLENVNPENQALMILISCFVKTSHHEEYLCVKEAILLDLLRVISHHKARLATPIRSIQKFYSDADLESMPFSDSIFSHGGPMSKRPVLLIDSYKVNGEEKPKPQARPVRASGEEEVSGTSQAPSTPKADGKVKGSSNSETSKSDNKSEGKIVAETSNIEARDENKTSAASNSKSKSSSPGTGVTGLKNLESTASGPQSKQVGKSPASDSSKSTSLEENIVLGVALEGSKRTLPIEEGLDSPLTPLETKEVAARSNGNSVLEKDEKDK